MHLLGPTNGKFPGPEDRRDGNYIRAVSQPRAHFSHVRSLVSPILPFPCLAIRSSTTHWELRPRDDRRLDGTSSSFHAALPPCQLCKASYLLNRWKRGRLGKGKGTVKVVGYLCAINSHHPAFREQILVFLASCSSRRHWRAEARRARVALKGQLRPCAGPSISAARKHQPHLTSETMDAGVHVKATRGREEGTRRVWAC
jgi:hypothetical protein